MYVDRTDKPNSVVNSYLSGTLVTQRLERHPESAKRSRYGLARG